jgi:hypothetical protein
MLTTTNATNHIAQITATTSQTMSQLAVVMRWPMCLRLGAITLGKKAAGQRPFLVGASTGSHELRRTPDRPPLPNFGPVCPGEAAAPIDGASPSSRRPGITIQHHHDIAFHDWDVGIWSTRPPTNQHPTTLLKRLTWGKSPSLFYMHRVTYAPRAPPSTMLGIPDQMGQFVCHSSTPRFPDLWGGALDNTLRR